MAAGDTLVRVAREPIGAVLRQIGVLSVKMNRWTSGVHSRAGNQFTLSSAISLWRQDRLTTVPHQE